MYVLRFHIGNDAGVVLGIAESDAFHRLLLIRWIRQRRDAYGIPFAAVRYISRAMTAS